MRALSFCLAIFLMVANTARAQERQWTIDQTDKEAYLAFGVPETDDVGVSFWCKLQSDVINFYAPESDKRLKISTSQNFVIEVSSRSFRFKGKTSASRETSAISLEAELKISEPVFAALQDADRFSVNIGKDKQNFPLTDADFDSFLRVCRKS
jgi:hypothetical protein